MPVLREFGRTAWGRVAGDFPGLSAEALFENRDHLRLAPEAVARAFPQSEAAPPVAGLVRG